MKYSIKANGQIRHKGKRIEFEKGSTFETTDKELIEKLDKSKLAAKVETKTATK